MNAIQITGRMVRDAQVKTTKNGKAPVDFYHVMHLLHAVKDSGLDAMAQQIAVEGAHSQYAVFFTLGGFAESLTGMTTEDVLKNLEELEDEYLLSDDDIMAMQSDEEIEQRCGADRQMRRLAEHVRRWAEETLEQEAEPADAELPF